jgi:adenosylcobinamide-phosphate synthase
MRSRAAGLLLGFVADRLLGDPSRWHPVAGFGRAAAALERAVHADSRAQGACYATALVGSSTLVGMAIDSSLGRRPVLHTVAVAAATWAVLGGTSLGREASAVERLLADDDLPAARDRLTHLVGRDTSRLDASEIARATIESVAENTSDAVVAPLVLGGLGGIGGLLGYRAANTLDAMVGHRSARYERFGWASARLDDVLNVPGSRLSALLASGFAPEGRRLEALRTWRTDAAGHPSPNAGPVESAFAGALGVRLGGTNTYGSRVERRPVMGSGRPATPIDIARAIRLADRVGWGAIMLIALGSGLSRRRPTAGPRTRD